MEMEARDRRGGVDEQGIEREPGQHGDGRELLHRRRHILEVGNDLDHALGLARPGPCGRRQLQQPVEHDAARQNVEARVPGKRPNHIGKSRARKNKQSPLADAALAIKGRRIA